MSGNTQYEQEVTRHLASIAQSSKKAADSMAEFTLLFREFLEQNMKRTFADWMKELGVQYEIYDSAEDEVIPFTETPVTKELFWRSIEQLDVEGKLRKVQPKPAVMQKDDLGRMLPHEWRIFLDLPALEGPGPENEKDLMTEEAFRIYNAGFSMAITLLKSEPHNNLNDCVAAGCDGRCGREG